MTLWAKLLTFGPLYRKDQRLEMGVKRYVMNTFPHVPATLLEGSEHCCDAIVRTLSMKAILKTDWNKEKLEVSHFLFLNIASVNCGFNISR